MFSIATPPCHRSSRRRPPSAHAGQTRRQRRLDHKRRRRRRKARAARRQRQRLQERLPKPARSLFETLAGSFTRPTFLRFIVSALATIPTAGRRTVCNLLRTLGTLAPGHPSSYHRVSCQRRWSCWRLAHGLANWVSDQRVPPGRVLSAGHDTADGHQGAKVFGKGCHRDPVRPTHSLTAFRWGRKWVVLAVLVRFPFTRRLWALPVLVALDRTAKDNAQAGRRHKTPARLPRQLGGVLPRGLRQRRFVLAGDGNYGPHEMARFACRRHGRPDPVSTSYPDAQLYAPPPPSSGPGRPRVGLYTVAAALDSRLPRQCAQVRGVDWPGKQDVIFSDAITAVRRWLWPEGVVAIPGYGEALHKRAGPFRAVLLYGLAPAA